MTQAHIHTGLTWTVGLSISDTTLAGHMHEIKGSIAPLIRSPGPSMPGSSFYRPASLRVPSSNAAADLRQGESTQPDAGPASFSNPALGLPSRAPSVNLPAPFDNASGEARAVETASLSPSLLVPTPSPHGTTGVTISPSDTAGRELKDTLPQASSGFLAPESYLPHDATAEQDTWKVLLEQLERIDGVMHTLDELAKVRHLAVHGWYIINNRMCRARYTRGYS